MTDYSDNPSIKDIAEETLKCALSWEPGACLIGNVTAQQVSWLCYYALSKCFYDPDNKVTDRELSDVYWDAYQSCK
jgi:hypothetical protein